MSFTINSHKKTNRVQVVNIKSEDLDRLIFPFQKHTITSLEYKPFSRFSLAKSLDEVFENKLSKTLIETINNRETGVAIIEPEISNKKFDKEFLRIKSILVSDIFVSKSSDNVSLEIYDLKFSTVLRTNSSFVAIVNFILSVTSNP